MVICPVMPMFICTNNPYEDDPLLLRASAAQKGHWARNGKRRAWRLAIRVPACVVAGQLLGRFGDIGGDTRSR